MRRPVAMMLCTLVLSLPLPVAARTLSTPSAVQTQLAGVAMPFIANEGQVDARVAYYASTFAGTLFVTHQGQLIYALTGP